MTQQALGIRVGDQIWTSYGHKPGQKGPVDIVTEIHGPDYWEAEVGCFIVRSWPVISVTYESTVLTGERRGPYWINDIRRECGRWFDDSNEEVFVAPRGRREAQEPEGTPWSFRDGVKYGRHVWHCETCGDFNAPPEDEDLDLRWHCPTCGKYGVMAIYVMTPRQVGRRQENSYSIGLDQLWLADQQKQEKEQQ